MFDLKICIVEDDISALESLSELLKLDNFDIEAFSNPIKAFDYIKHNPVDLVISDIKMPHLDGLTLLKKIKELNSSIEIILMTAFGDINTAIEAIKLGANHYILKPINYEELKNCIFKVAELKRLKTLVSFSSEKHIPIVAESAKMKALLNIIKTIAPTDTTVLIEGETGTGKELVSRLIHNLSKRHDYPFLPVNCAALPKDLLEAELFGFEKGSFTGAIYSKKGKFLLADKGTIFLDEISEMDFDIQAKLLRVLEDGKVFKIGGEKSFETDIRIIAATNKNLEQLVSQGKFRNDLFFRLNVLRIEIPPLRERKDDILPLITIFIDDFNKKYDKSIKQLSDEALKKLLSYSFPGNVRELKHIIERAVILSTSSVIEAKDIIISSITVQGKEEKNGIFIPFNMPLREAENKVIIETLRKNNYNKKKTAEILGISVRNIELRFREMGVTLKDLKSEVINEISNINNIN